MGYAYKIPAYQLGISKKLWVTQIMGYWGLWIIRESTVTCFLSRPPPFLLIRRLCHSFWHSSPPFRVPMHSVSSPQPTARVHLSGGLRKIERLNGRAEADGTHWQETDVQVGRRGSLDVYFAGVSFDGVKRTLHESIESAIPVSRYPWHYNVHQLVHVPMEKASD
ncbi:hypothetical protein EDB85DRAFT_1002446 [Lactarius pseudohatsudake]|nr:hypothetical protein EDB85DRAFT_1002446 [Lactarius pseudohatsudake]